MSSSFQKSVSQFKSNECPKTYLFSVKVSVLLIWGNSVEQTLDEAKNGEIYSLFERERLKMFSLEGPDNANMLSGRFVLAIKDEGTKNIWKARFVFQGPKDKVKHLVHNIPVVRQHSIKLLLILASRFSFKLFSSDVTPNLYSKHRTID